MAGIIAAVLGIIALAWFLRRLFPALFAAVFVLAAPAWLVGGLLLDLLRRPLAFLRPVGLALARLVVLRGAVATVPAKGQPGPGRGQAAHADAGRHKAHSGRDRPGGIPPAAGKRIKEFLSFTFYE